MVVGKVALHLWLSVEAWLARGSLHKKRVGLIIMEVPSGSSPHVNMMKSNGLRCHATHTMLLVAVQYGRFPPDRVAGGMRYPPLCPCLSRISRSGDYWRESWGDAA